MITRKYYRISIYYAEKRSCRSNRRQRVRLFIEKISSIGQSKSSFILSTESRNRPINMIIAATVIECGCTMMVMMMVVVIQWWFSSTAAAASASASS